MLPRRSPGSASRPRPLSTSCVVIGPRLRGARIQRITLPAISMYQDVRPASRHPREARRRRRSRPVDRLEGAAWTSPWSSRFPCELSPRRIALQSRFSEGRFEDAVRRFQGGPGGRPLRRSARHASHPSPATSPAKKPLDSPHDFTKRLTKAEQRADRRHRQPSSSLACPLGCRFRGILPFYA